MQTTVAQSIYFEDASDVARLTTGGSGNGVAVHDYDGDGWDDIFIAVSRGVSALFNNRGDGSFANVTAAAGVDVTGNYSVALWGDVDNDGHTDLFIGSRNAGDNKLFLNNGDGTFFDATATSGLDPAAILASAAFADVDGDGALDLFFAVDRAADMLYRNTNGTGPTLFEDISSQAGIEGVNMSVAMQSSWVDYDNDGDPDLFSVHDSRTPSRLYRNEGFFPLINVAATAKIESYPDEIVCCNMGVAWGDYNSDGWLDAYVTRIGHGGLYRNNGDGTFTDVAAAVGAARNGMSWGVVFADFDNDGDSDLFIVSTSGYDGTPTLLYRNDDFFFSEIGSDANSSFHVESQGVAQGDFNNDGRPDLVIARHDGRNMLLINSTVGQGNWIKINLKGTRVNRAAIGTRVEVVAGGNTYLRYVSGGDSYASQSSSTIHVGIGSATLIDTVRVHWSADNIEEVTDLSVNASYEMIESVQSTNAAPSTLTAESIQLLEIYPNPFVSKTNIRFSTPEFGRIRIEIFDLLGRLITVLADTQKPGGSHEVVLNAHTLPSGLYFLRLQTTGHIETKQMVLTGK